MPDAGADRRPAAALRKARQWRAWHFIRHARELGFEVDAIRALLSLQDDPDQPCASADEIAKARLAEVDRRIASLTALRKELHKMIDECGYGCVG